MTFKVLDEAQLRNTDRKIVAKTTEPVTLISPQTIESLKKALRADLKQKLGYEFPEKDLNIAPKGVGNIYLLTLDVPSANYKMMVGTGSVSDLQLQLAGELRPVVHKTVNDTSVGLEVLIREKK